MSNFSQSAKEKVVLVHIDVYNHRASERDLKEFEELAISAGALVTAFLTGKAPTPNPKYFAGSGKVEEIKMAVLATKAVLVIFDHTLTPAQERNLEKFLSCRVLDKPGLILDIFARRARTFEGKLQVELAQLEHLSTRLVRGWQHLERQRGGIGLKGPGETQLETDRRLLKKRVATIKKRLEKVFSQRRQTRRGRKRSMLPTVVLVGYTNAGKSTLFNKLTAADVYVADKLFATLDPTFRKVTLPFGKAVIVADTVGFIKNLPHELIESFNATLEETKDADLLLHIVDASDPEKNSKIETVNNVLEKIGAEKVPQLLVYNKIDLVPDFLPRIDYNQSKKPEKVWLSAVSGEGIKLLLKALGKIIFLSSSVRITQSDQSVQ
jgi:GTPase